VRMSLKTLNLLYLSLGFVREYAIPDFKPSLSGFLLYLYLEA